MFGLYEGDDVFNHNFNAFQKADQRNNHYFIYGKFFLRVKNENLDCSGFSHGSQETALHYYIFFSFK